jgi:hypothetical protein
LRAKPSCHALGHCAPAAIEHRRVPMPGKISACDQWMDAEHQYRVRHLQRALRDELALQVWSAHCLW